MRFNLATFLIVFLALVIQELILPLNWAHGAFLFIAAAAFFCCAISVPFPVMLGLAFFTGLIWDGLHVIIPSEVELSNPQAALKDIKFGYSILLFGVLGGFMQGVRPLFRRGRWELPIIMTGVGTFLFLLIQYLLVNFTLGGLVFPERIWFKLMATALLSMLISPLVFFILHRLAIMTDYQIRYEGFRRRLN
ncbi:MAG: hypothetical protein ACI9UA_006278 [Pseudoalteromonas tetraodonis]|jgi:hypothetical protein